MISWLNNMQDPMIRNVGYLLKAEKVLFNHHYLKKSLRTKPNYPSLGAVTAVLDQYSIKNLAVEINFEQLLQVPRPCLVHINQNKAETLVTVLDITEGAIIYRDNGSVVHKEMHEFESIWTGKAILIEKSTVSKEPNYTYHKLVSTFKLLGITTLVALLCLFLLWSASQYQYNVLSVFGLYILAGVGLVASWLLTHSSFDPQKKMAHQFCGASNQANCASVLESKASTLFGIHLSEIGLVYFSTFVLCLFIGSSTSKIAGQQVLNVLFLFNLLSLLFTLYSIYYQKVVLNTWCYLCLSVVGALWFIALLSYGNVTFMPISWKASMALAGSLLVTVGVWSFFRRHLVKGFKSEALGQKIHALKSNKHVLNALLSSAQQVDKSSLEAIKTVTGGTTLTVTLISNPFCKPCALAHKKLQTLLRHYPNQFNVAMVFSTAMKRSKSEEVVQHINAHALTGSDCLVEMIDDWYQNLSESYFDKWKRKYPLKDEVKSRDFISAQQRWIKEAGIDYTPAVLINDRIFPKELDILDLPRFLN